MLQFRRTRSSGENIDRCINRSHFDVHIQNHKTFDCTVLSEHNCRDMWKNNIFLYLFERGNNLLDWLGELMLRLDVFLGVKGDRVERESSELLNILSTSFDNSGSHIQQRANSGYNSMTRSP